MHLWPLAAHRATATSRRVHRHWKSKQVAQLAYCFTATATCSALHGSDKLHGHVEVWSLKPDLIYTTLAYFAPRGSNKQCASAKSPTVNCPNPTLRTALLQQAARSRPAQSRAPRPSPA